MIKNSIAILSISILISVLFILGVYAAWYSYNRQAVISEIEKCNYTMEHPNPPTAYTDPNGNIVSVVIAEPCLIIPIPPSLWDLFRGRIILKNILNGMEVNPYSLRDILLANYTLGPGDLPCDQSATTTPCGTFETVKAVELGASAPYIPPNVVYPSAEWTSATDTPITLSGFTFELPPGWHGEIYEKGFYGGVNALIRSESSDRGFTISCPPDGKGLEAATSLSSEERTFTKNSVTYSTAFEEWTAPGNDPWYFVWVRTFDSGETSAHTPSTVCLAQGSVTPDIKDALRMYYETMR